MIKNTYIEPTEKESKPKVETKPKKKVKSKKSMVRILNGDFLSEKVIVENLPFLGFIVFLLVCLIAWGYHTENVSKEELRLERELGELNSEYFTLGSEYNRLSRQTQVVNRLKESGLIESVDPPKKIKIKKFVFH